MFKIPFLSKNKSGKQVNPEPIKLLVGLGNPDKKYERTFHNVGFAYIDHLTKKEGLKFKKYKDFEFSKMGNLVLIKPRVLMNQSGISVKQAVKYFGVKPQEVAVVHDDSDLEIGGYKVSFGRGSAGHKGAQSIINHLKTNKFTRIRIGVRDRRGKAGEFVLKKASKASLEKIDQAISEIETRNL